MDRIVANTPTQFIEPMLLLPTTKLPEGVNWLYQVKLDGYRAIAVKTAGTVRLRSRNDKNFNVKYPTLAAALLALPDETVVDGEIVATAGCAVVGDFEGLT